MLLDFYALNIYTFIGKKTNRKLKIYLEHFFLSFKVFLIVLNYVIVLINVTKLKFKKFLF